MRLLFRLPTILITLLALSLVSGYDFAYAQNKSTNLNEELKLNIGDEVGNEIKSLKTELLINSNDEKALRQLTKLLQKYKYCHLWNLVRIVAVPNFIFLVDRV